VRDRCARVGCDRYPASGYPTCSLLCGIVLDKLTKAEELCKQLGLAPESGELWAGAVALNDAFTEYSSAYRAATRALQGSAR
jgi:hypothetical protein